MIISLISQKGGVGKSTLARLMAVEFARAGWDVKIADLDRLQGTSTIWKARRDREGVEPEIAVEKYATVERAIRDAERHDLMILDGPAHAEKGGKAMAIASDLVILPTGFGLDDMDAQIEAAYELEENGVSPEKLLFVFVNVHGSEREEEAARQHLRRARLNVLDAVLPEKPSIRMAHNLGRAASEVPFKSVQEKILPVVQAISNTIIQTKAAA